MNKQLVSFLSLFSLVLVLSIYYVMLPFKGTNLGDTNNPVDKPVISEQEDTTDSYFVSLELQKDEAYELLIKEQEAILSSKDATIEEKIQALEEISNIQTKIEKEDDTVSAIIEAGYPAAYVERYDQGIKVVVYQKDATKKDAAIVMALVIEEFGLESQPEVTFYS